MGKLARVAVDGEAENKLTEVLKDTKKYTAYGLNNEQEVEVVSESGIFQRIFINIYCIGIIGLLIVVGLAIWFTRRNSKKSR
jgi:cytochrome c biogenesis protein ResB